MGRCLAAVWVAAAVITPVHAREITMRTLNWEPYDGEELPRQGFFTELVGTAFERAGHQVKVEFMPWARAKLGGG
jgi:polar amino acid transport system substrate-binding protein